MDLHPGEQIVFEGHPSWRGLLSFYIDGIDRPERVVAAVDRAQRDAATAAVPARLR